MQFRLPITFIAGAALTLAGCGGSSDQNDNDSDTGSGGGSTPSLEVSNSASQSTEVADEAIAYAIASSGEQLEAVAVRSHSSSLLATWRATTSADRWVYRVGDIDFRNPEDVDRTVDLDEVGPDGEDLFPNATGAIRVQATANASGDSTSGTVSFDPVTITYVEEVVVTNPENGNTAAWPADTSYGGSVSLEWQRADHRNWSYGLTISKNVTDKMITITRASDGEEFAGLINESWTRLMERRRAGEDWGASHAANGERQVDWTRTSDGATRTVRWVVASLSDITVYIDGVIVFQGTYEELRRVLGASGRA